MTQQLQPGMRVRVNSFPFGGSVGTLEGRAKYGRRWIVLLDTPILTLRALAIPPRRLVMLDPDYPRQVSSRLGVFRGNWSWFSTVWLVLLPLNALLLLAPGQRLSGQGSGMIATGAVALAFVLLRSRAKVHVEPGENIRLRILLPMSILEILGGIVLLLSR